MTTQKSMRNGWNQNFLQKFEFWNLDFIIRFAILNEPGIEIPKFSIRSVLNSIGREIESNQWAVKLASNIDSQWVIKSTLDNSTLYSIRFYWKPLKDFDLAKNRLCENFRKNIRTNSNHFHDFGKSWNRTCFRSDNLKRVARLLTVTKVHDGSLYNS